MYFSFALIINVSWIFSKIDALFYVSPRKQLNSCVRIANFVTHNCKVEFKIVLLYTLFGF